MIETFFNPEIIAAAYPIVLSGLLNTILLSLLVVPLGFAGGMILALLASARQPWVRWPLMAWVDFFRAFPPLVLLIFLFAGLPFAGLELGGFTCVAIAFFLNTGSYYGEILRAGIESIPRGQVEAARSTGLTGFQSMTYIVMPQALRLTVAPLTNRTIAITKGTALGTVVALHEILGMASSAVSNSYNPSPLMMGAAAYLALFLPVVVLARWIETRFAWKR